MTTTSSFSRRFSSPFGAPFVTARRPGIATLAVVAMESAVARWNTRASQKTKQP